MIRLTWGLWYSQSPEQLSKRLKIKSWPPNADLKITICSLPAWKDRYLPRSNPNFCCQDFLRFYVMFKFCNLPPGLAFRHIPDLNRGFSRINVRKSGFRRISDCINLTLVRNTVRRPAIDHFIYKRVKTNA